MASISRCALKPFFRSLFSLWRGASLLAALAFALFLAPSGQAHAAPQSVVCIVWQADPTKPHIALPDRDVLLKAVVKADSTAALKCVWSFGDGSPDFGTTLSGKTFYTVEATHRYTGAPGTTYEASIRVSNLDGSGALSDTYRIAIGCPGIDAEANIAIDDGLWYLYKQQGTDGSWVYGSYRSSPTASAVHAFENNSHFETGNPAEDPYADAVRRGLQYLFRTGVRAMDITGHAGDVNGNRCAIEPADSMPAYQLGMIMDAIIGTGTPMASCGRDFDRDGAADTYAQVVQDMCDAYSWGQYDDQRYGGWRYVWNQAPDNSANQWAAIGMIPAERVWGCVIPGWVKTSNYNWLKYSYRSLGCCGDYQFGYKEPCDCGWCDSQATTPSGLIQLVFDGKDRSDPMWREVIERRFHNLTRWDAFVSTENYYAWYAFVKAMRVMHEAHPLNFPVEADACGVKPLGYEFLENGFNWYRGSGGKMGLARRLLDLQVKTGLNRGSWSVYWCGKDYGRLFSTAWSILMLTPTPCFVCCPSIMFFADSNGDGIFQSEEASTSTCLGVEVTYTLAFSNSSDVPVRFTISMRGIPSEWVSLPDLADQTCGAQPHESGDVCLLPGEVRRVPIRIRPQEAGAFLLSAEVISVETGSVCLSPERSLIVSDSTLIRDASPANGVAVCTSGVDITWSTCGVTTGTLSYRPVSDPPSAWIDLAEDALGTEHRVRLSNLELGRSYEWTLRVEDPEDPENTVALATPRVFAVTECVAFVEDAWSFEIPRGYEIVRAVAIENRTDVAREVTLTLKNPYSDLFAGFAGPGSQDEPLVLPAHSRATVKLGLHSQDTRQRVYQLSAVLQTADVPPLVDRATITIVIKEPAVDFTLERASEREAGTLTNHLSVHNLKDPLTDLFADAPSLEGLVTMVPTVDHVQLGTGKRFLFDVVPNLRPDPNDPAKALPIVGRVRAGALGGTVERFADLDFSPPEGEQLFLARLVMPSVCESGAGWYCTNRPRIEIAIKTPAGFQTRDIRSASLRMNFTPSPRWSHRPHDVFIYLNGEGPGNLVGSFLRTIPNGTYTFPVPAQLVNASAHHPVVNTVYIHSNHNGGHYVVTANATLCLCLESYERYIYAHDQEEANLRLSRISNLVSSATDLSVVIESPEGGSMLQLGSPATVRARVLSRGNPAPGLSVLARLSSTDGVFPLLDDGQHDDLAPNDGVYANTWTPVTAGDPYCIEVTASSCAGSASARVEVRTVKNDCDLLVECLNKTFDFFDSVPGEDSRYCPEVCCDPPKLLASDLDADDLWVTFFYPAVARFFDGDDLTCEVDANAWFSGADPTGRVPLDLRLDLGGLIPSGDLKAILRDQLSGGIEFGGAIARNVPACDVRDPKIFSRISMRVWAAALPANLSLEGAGNVVLRYDPQACFAAEADPQIDMGISGELPGLEIEKSLKFFGVRGALKFALKPTFGGRAGLLVPGEGEIVPPAAVLAAVAELAPSVEATLDLPDAVKAFFDVDPTLGAEATGRALSLVEVAIARRDLRPEEKVRSPYFFDDEYGHRVAYQGLGALDPVLFLRLKVDLLARATITFDPRGEAFPPQERSWEFPIRFELTRHWGNATVKVGSPVSLAIASDDGVLVDGVEEFGALVASKRFTGTPIQALIRGQTTGTYSLLVSWPAVFVVPDADGGRMSLVRRIAFRTAVTRTAEGDIDPWILDATTLTATVQDLVDGGKPLEDALAEVMRTVDNDRDGIADVRDPEQSSAKKLPFLTTGDLSADAGTEVSLWARLTFGGAGVPGKKLEFFLNSSLIGAVVTGPDGQAVLGPYRLPADLGAGRAAVLVSFAGDDEYFAATSRGNLEVRNDPPVVRITKPEATSFGYGDTVNVECDVSDTNLETVSLEHSVLKDGKWQTSKIACEQHCVCEVEGPGWHRIRVEAKDALGATGSDEVVFLIGRYFVRGDANDDGKIDIGDAVFILGFLFLGGDTPHCLEAANVDGQEVNGQRIVITDPVYLLNWMFLGGPEPPPPFRLGIHPDANPGCGLFLGGDVVSCDRYESCGKWPQ